MSPCRLDGDEEYPFEKARERMIHGLGQDEFPNESIIQLRIASGLCNAAEFDASTLDRPIHLTKIYGDPTDQAILRLSDTLGSVNELRSNWKKLFEIPFNSRNKFMIRIHVLYREAGFRYLFIKGAPDVLLPRCSSYFQQDGTIGTLSQTKHDEIEAFKHRWSAQGKRVILLARKPISEDFVRSLSSSQADKTVMEAAEGDLTLVGIVGIIDPPVTGDYKLTAQAIARECGIIRTHPSMIHDIHCLRSEPTAAEGKPPGDLRAIVLSGADLSSLTPTQWDQLCEYEIVFARTTPEQKLRIVKEFQARDNIVAMTGDGVNDAPSLKAADIGVALGSGSDIAVEAADMVLLDSFSAVVEAVKYGRLVYDNLKKTIIYLLPAGSFSELWPIMTNVILGVPQILSSFLMIIICCLTDCVGAISLAFEEPEMDVLLRPPRNAKKDRFVNTRLLLHAYGSVGLYECFLSFVMGFCALILKYGFLDPKYDQGYVTQVTNEASSIYFVNLVVMQSFNLLAVRTRRLSIFQQPPLFNKETQNWLLFSAMLFALSMVFILCYIPGLQRSIGTTSVPVEHFFLPVAFGLGLLLLDEGRKYWVRRWPKGFIARIAW
ncbi:hypothetical protein VTN00DRAFT_6823 [Thermoascus crustaceus]|uniref:uncharacterized protein n=1 Tax=Thermoascus crustaceus TaxID=5088 RepID=UPI0037438473